MEKRIETFKTGPFVFSLNYDKDKLNALLVEAKILYRTVAGIPILPDLAARLEEDLIKKSIFGTAAIEGNPLSEDDVKKILLDEEIKNKTQKAEKQITNLKSAYQIIKDTVPSGSPFILNEELIKKLNTIITTDCEEPDNVPGSYRKAPVKVGDQSHGGVYTPPKVFDDIKNLMGHFVEWINSPELAKEDEAVRACFAHYYLALIHPFGNGNGRTARAVEAIMLKSAGIKFVPHMLSNFYYKNIDDYFWAFSKSERNEKNDITPFVEFFLTGFVASLTEIRDTIFAWIRKFTLEDYYKHLRRAKVITQRQFNFLTLLLNNLQGFFLKDLYEKDFFKVIYRGISERTARRDLENLKEKRLIIINEKGSYDLNYMILG